MIQLMSQPTEFQRWVLDELAKRPRGTRTALAEYAGMTPDKLTRSLNWESGKETRQILFEEAEKMRRFFEEHPVDAEEPTEISYVDMLIEELEGNATELEGRMLLEIYRAIRRTGAAP